MRTNRSIVVVGCVMVLLFAPRDGSAQTRTGTVGTTTTHTYAFTPASSGQLLATLSWTNASANLLMLMACGTSSNILTFGIGGGLLDRFARFESGILATNPCVIAVSSAQGSSGYQLNVQRSSAQNVQRTVSGFAQLDEVQEGDYLGDIARRALEALKPLTLK